MRAVIALAQIIRNYCACAWSYCGNPSAASGLCHSTLQVRCQQPMEQVLSCFPANGQSARAIRSRAQAALHRFTDVHVFVIHTLADSNAPPVALGCGLAHIVEVEVEDDFAA